MMRFLTLVAAAGLALSGAEPVAAQAIPDTLVRAELRDGWLTPDGTRMAALHLVMAPGWKTYWRAPGEAGIPPRFDWSASRNLGAVTVHWPRPDVFELGGIRTFGYHDELVLPVELRPAKADTPIHVAARVDLGVCEEVCVPVTVDVSGDPSGSETDPLIRAALDDQPEPAQRAGLTSVKCSADPIRDGLRLTTALKMPPLGKSEIAVIELADQTIWVSPADMRREGGTLFATVDMVPANAKPFALDRSGVRVTVFGDNRRVVEQSGCSG